VCEITWIQVTFTAILGFGREMLKAETRKVNRAETMKSLVSWVEIYSRNLGEPVI
jgi:hypothetical protein